VIAGLEARPHIVADHASDDSIAGMAERALAVAPQRFAIVAHAMGGFVAFELTRRAPERVAQLVLLSTLAPADTPVQTERRMGYARLVEQGQFARVVEERIPILVHPARRSDAALLASVRRMAEDTGAEAFLRQQRAIMTRQDSRPSLARIAVPTLIACGREDGIVTLAQQQEMERGIRGARLEIVEDCGHLIALEQPARLVALLRGWLG
jgi:pimeloyl-ACP methyl ester carboxylesterase